MSKETTLEQDQGQAIVKAWNDLYPVGTAVILVDDFGDLEHTVTRTPAGCLGCGEPMVGVEGRSGGYMLSRIIPKPAPQGFQLRFDGPPGADGPRFIECENLEGEAIRAGQWYESYDGTWLLRVRCGEDPKD